MAPTNPTQRLGLSGAGSSTLAFLRGHIAASKSGHMTHTRLDGGTYTVHPSDMAEFQRCVGDDLCRGREIPAISEIHSMVFPFYVDIDLEVGVTQLTDEAVLEITSIMNAQLARFYPDDARTSITKCLVCTKTGDGPEPGKTEGRYKHGAHLHWPNVIVNRDQARQIVAGMNAGLGVGKQWKQLLGAERIDWEEMLDCSVYDNGLRIVGAVKARTCGVCKNKPAEKIHCTECGCTGYMYSHRVYKLRAVVQDQEFDEGEIKKYVNQQKVVEHTSVRTKNEAVETAGFARYPLCPHPPSDRKRKGTATDPTDKAIAQMRKKTMFVDSAKNNVARELLNRLAGRFKDRYANCILEVRCNEKGDQYMALISGDGRHFCMNKQREHSGNRNYMKIQHDGKGSARAFMCCFSTKPTTDMSGRSCKGWCSESVKLTKEERSVLFADGPLTDLRGLKGGGPANMAVDAFGQQNVDLPKPPLMQVD